MKRSVWPIVDMKWFKRTRKGRVAVFRKSELWSARGYSNHWWTDN